MLKTILRCLLIFVFWANWQAYAGNYLNSAHGNSNYGVKRTTTSQYSQGHCAHCHEQHASIGGSEPAPNTDKASGPDNFCFLAQNFDNTLTTRPTTGYSQDDNGCFYCHTSSGAVQDGGSITNYNYSTTFGGAPQTVTSIMDAFNISSYSTSSYHNLHDIVDFISTEWSGTFNSASNPCSGCHNVHLAKRSCGKPSGSFDPTQAAISRPSDHNSTWGDDDNERMDSYAGTYTYQAPYWYNSTTVYEPDGSNLPDYVSYCQDCHSSSVYSTTLGRYTIAIDWASPTSGDKHGKYNASAYSSRGTLKPPYNDSNSGDYVLSCMDCHEPHGSQSEYLLRTEVNGVTETTVKQDSNGVPATTTQSITITTSGQWLFFCSACHDIEPHGSGSKWDLDCRKCHAHGDKF